MSIRIGTVEHCPHLAATVRGGIGEVSFDPSVCVDPTVDVEVRASSAGVELVALPCALSLSDAECLISLLSLAVRRSKGMAYGSSAGVEPRRWQGMGNQTGLEPPGPYVPTDAELAREDELKAEDRAQGMAERMVRQTRAIETVTESLRLALAVKRSR